MSPTPPPSQESDPAGLARAKELIRQAKETRAETLDLSGLSIKELPEELGELVWLKELVLSRCDQLTDVSALRGLAQLTSLNLSRCSQLTDVSALRGLTQLTTLGLGWCPQLTDVSALRGLTQLTTLGLGWCPQLTDVSALRGLAQLTTLYLDSCSRLTDVSALRGLTQLTTLDLSWCYRLTDVSALRGLTQLTTLDLSGCDQLTDVSALRGLTQLTTLDLSECDQLTDVSALRGLTQLTSLNLSRCSQLTDVSALRGLTQLTTLGLVCCDQLTDVSALRGLTQLTTLRLIGCDQLTDVSALRGLAQLTTLVLSECPQLTDVSALRGLTQLTTLRLIGCNQLTDVSALSGLTQLTTLDLSGCDQLTDVSALSGLTLLTTLELSGCDQLTDVSALRGLTQLTMLDLRGCKSITQFPDFLLDLPRLKNVGLDESGIRDIPLPLLGSCLPAIRAHFADLEQGEELDREVKLIVLGNGRVGKTSLCRRLIDHEFDPEEKSTHGIKFWTWRLSAEGGDEARKIDFNVWDFGGQDIYYGTHALFHKGRAVFMIVWDEQTERSEFYDDSEHHLRHRNYPVQYWLDYVKAVSPGSPVVIVQNKCASDFEHQPVTLEPRHSELAVVQGRFCASERGESENNRRLLEHQIFQAAQRALGHPGAQRIGVGRWGVKQKLRRMLDEGAEENRTLSLEQYQELCAGHHLDATAADALLTFLHDSGTLFYQADLFDGTIILDQRWACDAIYTLLDRERSYPAIRRNGGQFTARDLNYLAWERAGYAQSEQELFIKMMLSCEICFELGRDEQGQTVWLAPELTPARAEAWPGCYWEEGAERTFYWRYDYDFLGPSPLRRAMVRLGKEYRQSARYWQDGFYLPLGETLGARARVSAEYGMGESLSRGWLTLEIQGDSVQARARMLRVVRELFEENGRWTERMPERLDWESPNPGVQALVSLDGEHWARVSALKEMHELGNPNVKTCDQHGQPAVPAPVQDFLPYLESSVRTHPEQERRNPPPDKMVLTSITSSNERPPMKTPKVFISYSHETREHMDRVLEFSNFLRRYGIDAELDRYQTRPEGGWARWCEQQLEKENSDFVLMVCTQVYRDRIRGKVPADEGRGVYWEGELIYNYIYDAKSKTRFVPVLLPGGEEAHIPMIIKRPGEFYNISACDESDRGFLALYDLLFDRSGAVKPPLGTQTPAGLSPVAAALPQRHVVSTLASQEELDGVSV